MADTSTTTTFAQAVAAYTSAHPNLSFALTALALMSCSVILVRLARNRVQYRHLKSSSRHQTLFESSPPPIFRPEPIQDFVVELEPSEETVVLRLGDWILAKRKHRAS
jgi:hypothetical protein